MAAVGDSTGEIAILTQQIGNTPQDRFVAQRACQDGIRSEEVCALESLREWLRRLRWRV
jgi:hypothetical protein